ncbi:alpha beta hydrolase [Pyrenophora seminiperda CCB06]|uniref:Alpha beta hydrolase n=1 Tax=Pyrenophora seminiperda CCB06 TaxID=1302712 RepID=A0A3M7M668_9PLEO|nr:alpha beta hydrolase [Pyrenophora seminiperda CCB06]
MESSLVNIGTHSLCLYSIGPSTSSPDSSLDTPAVLLTSGLSCSNLGWAAVIRLLSPHVRIYSYDRSGYGSSESSPLAPSAENIALELDLLVQKAGIKQPLVLVGHSWGGIIAPEYILRTGIERIAGLVLVDTNQPRTLEVTDWRDENILVVSEGIDYYTALGIRKEHKLTTDEFSLLMDELVKPHHITAGDRERLEYPQSLPTLGAKDIMKMNPPLLKDRPLCVVIGRAGKDYQGLYDAGVERGNGTEGQRRKMRELIETWSEKEEALQREQLVYSTNSTVMVAEQSGHRVELTQPEVVVDAVLWCLQEFTKLQ